MKAERTCAHALLRARRFFEARKVQRSATGNYPELLRETQDSRRSCRQAQSSMKFMAGKAGERRQLSAILLHGSCQVHSSDLPLPIQFELSQQLRKCRPQCVKRTTMLNVELCQVFQLRNNVCTRSGESTDKKSA